MKQIALLVLVYLAIMAIQTQRLRNAVIFMGVFSLNMSFVYLLYNAPDVAIAEAVIGSTLATILYLVALNKYKVFVIYCHVHEEDVHDGHYAHNEYSDLIKLLEIFCAKQELEPQIIYTTHEKETIMEEHEYAVIIEDHQEILTIYAHPENCQTELLQAFIEKRGGLDYPYHISTESIVEMG
jgi:uncharacterized MnhB-related membrane protein